MQIIRATKTAEQAGAYYVRIQAMARKHQITLYAEFDEHDTPESLTSMIRQRPSILWSLMTIFQ